jgi:hypothetical protein
MKADKTLFKVLASLLVSAFFLFAAGGSDEGSSSSSSGTSEPDTSTSTEDTPEPVFTYGEDDDTLPEEEMDVSYGEEEDF